MQKRDAIRRTLAGAALVTMAALPFAGAAHAQTDTDTDGPGGTTTTAVQVATTARPTATTARAGTGLARTGGDWAMPATVAGAGVAIAVGARRLARRPAL